MPRRKIDLSTSGVGRFIDMKTGKPVEVPILPIVCERAKYYRKLRGIEQKALAAELDIPASTVSNWENGRSRPDVDLLPALCNALHISMYDLFNAENPNMPYSVDQQCFIETYDRLSSGHQLAVRNLIDTLDVVEALESIPRTSALEDSDNAIESSAQGDKQYDSVPF